MQSKFTSEGIVITGHVNDDFGKILTPDALAFVKALHLEFSDTRKELLAKREERQKSFDAGALPDFSAETQELKGLNWMAVDAPSDLRDRKVEITGPAGDRKMVINALNSGANAYMADFEDSQAPAWNEVIQGQINVRDAIDRTIAFSSAEGKSYALNDKVATLIVRPRGWHLLEKHVLIDGEPVSASIFDFALYFFHNVKNLKNRGSGPYYYLPKTESGLEAGLWDRVFARSEEILKVPRGTIRATVLIETLPGAFEMESILYNLRDHITGLNCGRWDYIFSYIKKLRNHPEYTLPDRAQVTMDKAFLAAYVDLLIKTCHRHGVHAIGGMSAYIPIRGDEQANAVAMQKVRADKEREVRLGHDGTWVAHPGLVLLAREVFEAKLGSKPNQLEVMREDVNVTRDDMLRVPNGQVTLNGVKTNISVGLQYLESWLGGKGCVPINNLMEDAATAEICRAQLWQWIRNGVSLSEGGKVTLELVKPLIAEEVARLSKLVKGEKGPERVALAGSLFEKMVSAPQFPEFLTLPAYEELLVLERRS
jgi:malate synthase